MERFHWYLRFVRWLFACLSVISRRDWRKEMIGPRWLHHGLVKSKWTIILILLRRTSIKELLTHNSHPHHGFSPHVRHLPSAKIQITTSKDRDDTTSSSSLDNYRFRCVVSHIDCYIRNRSNLWSTGEREKREEGNLLTLLLLYSLSLWRALFQHRWAGANDYIIGANSLSLFLACLLYLRTTISDLTINISLSLIVSVPRWFL